VAVSSQSIKEKATEIGFTKVGIVPARALTREGELLEQWLSLGYQADMKWMESDPDLRTDPSRLLSGARSVVVLALNYYTPHQHSSEPGQGKVSRYAWGDDYHLVMKEKMQSLLDWIVTEKPGTIGKLCCDIQPTMDKAWAVRAGIGWMGKHSNVISREFGSWFFIGEIVLDIELDFDDAIVPDHCGTCTACLDACPTGAIVEPFLVDSNRCLSYATIELRTPELPETIEGSLSGWLYGCDICQDVCPWNRFQIPTEENRFEPRNSETSIDLTLIAQMEQDEYVERFRHSAVKRTKLSGLKRNAAALARRAAPSCDRDTLEIVDNDEDS
jgi:epoxyqueuosine reductase